MILLNLFKEGTICPTPIQIQLQLKCSLKSYQCFSTVSSCVDYVQMAPRKDRIFLITHSAEEGKDIIEACRTYPWLKGVYVVDKVSLDLLFSDIRIRYFDDWNVLLQELNADMLPWRRQSLAFRFFEQTQKTIRDVKAEAASFMWSQILLTVLKEIPSSKETIDDTLNMCADYYRDNPVQLAMIEECRSTYQSYDAVRWYTRGSFLYHRLNAALRTENVDALTLFRPFIVDLCNQIEEEQSCHRFSSPSITVYHGQRMSMEEIENLRTNVGNLVSANAFWSSSLDEEVRIIDVLIVDSWRLFEVLDMVT